MPRLEERTVTKEKKQLVATVVVDFEEPKDLENMADHYYQLYEQLKANNAPQHMQMFILEVFSGLSEARYNMEKEVKQNAE